MKGKGCSSGGGSGETFSSTVVFKRKGKKEAGHLEGADSSNDSILVRIQVIQPPPLFPGHSSFLFLFSTSRAAWPKCRELKCEAAQGKWS